MSDPRGRSATRRWWLLITAGVVGVLTCAALAVAIVTQGDTTAGGGDHIRAILEGEPIRAQDVSRYHCHDLEYPLITCFRDAADRDADVAAHEAEHQPERAGER